MGTPATAVAAAAAPAANELDRDALSRRARPSPTLARLLSAACAAPDTPFSALASASASWKRATAESSRLSVVSGAPKTSDPSAFAVLTGTPEQ